MFFTCWTCSIEFNTLPVYNNERTIFMMKIVIWKIYLHNEKGNMGYSNQVPRHFLKCGCGKGCCGRCCLYMGNFLIMVCNPNVDRYVYFKMWMWEKVVVEGVVWIWEISWSLCVILMLMDMSTKWFQLMGHWCDHSIYFYSLSKYFFVVFA